MEGEGDSVGSWERGREADSGEEDNTNDFLAQWVGSDT